METKTCQVNTERYLFLDILKVIALILMPCIHIFNMFDNFGFTGEGFPYESLSTQFGIIYLFVPGIFMFSMGAGIVLTEKSTPKDLCRRGLKLLLVGFILNVVRGSIFLWLGLLIESEYAYEFWYWLWGSDILYFAGLYFLLFALLRKWKCNDPVIAALSVVFLVISHVIMPVPVENPTLIQLLGNFFYIDVDSCFPFLSWCVFPTGGYLFMKYYLKAEKKKRYITTVSTATAIIFAGFCGILLLSGGMQSRYFLWGEEAFIMDIPSAVIALSVAGLYACSICYLASFMKPGKMTALISKISANVNTIYLIHWFFVMYLGLFLLVFCDVETNSPVLIYLVGVLVFAVSTALALGYQKMKSRKRIRDTVN